MNCYVFDDSFFWLIGIVFQPYEGRAFEAPSVKSPLIFIQSRKVPATTCAPVLASGCWLLVFYRFSSYVCC
ncbi:hypothetical protein CHX27_05560 [Flavobacterium aurantiibacter]|uniref:Uncharacterized protein n=1 Tax=Flavobacterium aurantiibacter TaxID=2023067 RepID=A0A255ZXV8_9FLAO|nr:hypothetical protein CHX27_05560 [Flavobacterium aurantiibacter]